MSKDLIAHLRESYDEDIMVNINVSLTRGGRVDSLVAYPTEPVSIAAVIVVGMLDVAKNSIWTGLQEKKQNG